MRFFISTIAADALPMARKYGIGIEIAEFCTAWNMDKRFAVIDKTLKMMLDGISCTTLHGPFNELFPCAIDPKARSLATYRYQQAIDLAKRYGSQKVIFHGGYHPWIYYPSWYVEQSIVFWKDFLKRDPGVEIVLENVLETRPEWLIDIVRGVDDPRLRMCLDIGHANAYSKIPVMEWLEECGPFISHFHVHNNDGSEDRHNALMDGSIPMERFLARAGSLCPDATCTLELTKAETSVQWLADIHMI